MVPDFHAFAGPWACHDIDTILARLPFDRESPKASSRRPQPQVSAPGVRTGRELQVIDVAGPLSKYGLGLYPLAGETSTIELRHEIRQAAAAQHVAGILLTIDSPGGVVAGTYDLVDDIREAATKKPVWAYIEDLGASAAYALACGCDRIYCNSTARVGAIGTYSVLADSSRMAAKAGVKVHLVRAGEFKGAGTRGTEVSDKLLAEAQKQIDQLNEFFLQAVAKGRKLAISRVRQLADGRVHIGASAVALGLADGVRNLNQVVEEMRRTCHL